MKDLSYNTVGIVIDLWDSCRSSHPNFDQEFGDLAFDKLFNDIKPNEDPKTVAKFKKQAKHLTGFVDSIIQVLGPDNDFLEMILLQVGARSILGGEDAAYGSSLFTYLGDAMILAMEQSLKRDFSVQEQMAFDEVYYAITEELSSGLLL